MTGSPSGVEVAAVDLGASSGRVMVGEVGRDHLRLRAVARFANEPVRLPDGLHWNVVELYRQALVGLREAVGSSSSLASVGVDSWAVDYGLLRDGSMLGLPFHYRDATRGRQASRRCTRVVGPAELYRRNGLQHLPFNTRVPARGRPARRARRHGAARSRPHRLLAHRRRP